jgi:hypothetical protein
VADDPRTEGFDLAALDEIRPGAWLAPGQQMVVNDELVRGLRFAHRPSQHELVADWLEVVPDFAPIAAFAHHYALASGGAIEVAEPHPDDLAPGEATRLVLRGPEGWLDGGSADHQALLSIDGSTLALDWVPLTSPPELDAGPVLATFERLGGGAPVPLLDLVLHLLIDHRGLFEDQAPVPLGDLLALAGLAVDGTIVRRAEVRPAARGAEPVGIPGLGLSSALAAERLLGAVLAVERGDQPDPAVAECLADVDGVAAMAEQLIGGDLVPSGHLAAALDALEPMARAPGQAGIAFLRSRLAEWEGDTEAQEAALDVAVRAGLPAAQVDAAWFAADRGEARAALGLLRAARVPADDPDLDLLTRYTAAGPRLVGRNDPCWCGSGRKHKQCCLRLNGHDLDSRTPWLHAKGVAFLQRPPQRTVLLRVATASAGVTNPEDAPARVIAAACDATVAELCLFEGGLFARFVEQRGALLPDDELELARSWAASRHRAWEVVAGALRDRRTGEERPLDARSAAKVPGAGLVLAVAQPGPMLLPGPVLPVADAPLSGLLPLLEDGAVEPIAALLGREFGWTAAPDLGSAVDPAPDALATP